MRALSPRLKAFGVAATLLCTPLAAFAHGHNHHAYAGHAARGHRHEARGHDGAHHKRHGRHISAQHHANNIDPNAPQSGMVVDATGRILSVYNPNQLVHPASVTKMMTLYLLFVALGNKWVTDDTLFTVSGFGASLGPKDILLYPGEKIPVRDISIFTPTVSLNAGARTIAENLVQFAPQYQNLLRASLASIIADHNSDEAQDPSSPEDAAEWTKFIIRSNQMIDGITSQNFGHVTDPGQQKEIMFARIMTAFAQIPFDMRDTVYHNASGVKDDEQVTTAADQIKLAYQVGHLPMEYFKRYSVLYYQYKSWNVHNHNKDFLTKYPGACGFKTGLINSSGFNVVDGVCGPDGRPIIYADSFGNQGREVRDVKIMMDIASAQQAMASHAIAFRTSAESDADNDTGKFQVGDTLQFPPVFSVVPAQTIDDILAAASYEAPTTPIQNAATLVAVNVGP